MDNNLVIKKLEALEMRLDNMEKILLEFRSFIEKPKLEKTKSTQDDKKNLESSNRPYKGIVGGVQFLIDNNFLNQLRSMREIYEELKREGYYYPLQSVDTTLRRDFVSRKKILSRQQVDGVWKYVLRK